MNIEIANRLYQYRKNMGISQEELAERIGVSRQAVSKWERAKASPDTDNLIELSKIYGVTLDELLKGSAAAPPDSSAADSRSDNTGDFGSGQNDHTARQSGSASGQENGSHAGFSADGGFHFHASDGKDNVNIGFNGVHIFDANGNPKVSVDRNGVFVQEDGDTKVYTDENGHVHAVGEAARAIERHKNPFLRFPYPIIAITAYLLFGVFNVCGGWAFGWIVLLTIPIYYTAVEAILKRDLKIFCYPVMVVIVYLILGFALSWWHPGWVLFLTIPIFYFLADPVHRSSK